MTKFEKKSIVKKLIMVKFKVKVKFKKKKINSRDIILKINPI